jgi:ligand-binding SRPBCC domain-containing protein
MPSHRFIERYPLPRSLVFAFFRNPANVVAVAPAELGMRLVEGPAVVSPGLRFTVEVRGWGLPQRIVTEVTQVEEPARIVEEQIQGPFRRWRLERVLAEVDGETQLAETIDYEPPTGMLGLLVRPAAVERELAQAYTGRVARVMERIATMG